MMQKSCIRKKIGTYFNAQNEFKDFLLKLPYKDKKRVLEAVISPEAGGKCLLRHVTAADYIENCSSIDANELFAPQIERGFTVETRFNIELRKIEALISSLHSEGLLSSIDINPFGIEV